MCRVRWCNEAQRGLREFRKSFAEAHETPTMGSRSAAGAPSGTAGERGRDRVQPLVRRPSAGRGSASPLLGQNAIARSAWAVIVSDGLTPRLAEIAEPSTTCRPG